MEKYFSNFWRNTSGSEIKSVAVKMSDMLEALKQVGNNLEEALGLLRQRAQNGPECPEWPKMAQNCPEWPRGPRMVQNGPEGPKWPRIAQNGPEGPE